MTYEVKFCCSCGHRLRLRDKQAIARFAGFDPRCIRCRIDEALQEREEMRELAAGGAR